MTQHEQADPQTTEPGPHARRARRLALLGGALAATATLAACGSGGGSGGGGGPIKIGMISPISGEAAVDGQFESRGARLAVSEINARGGVNGRRLQLVIEDGACDPAASASAAQKLLTRDRVALLEGAYCSSATAAIKPIAARYKIPLVSATSTAASLTATASPFFFRFAPTESLLAGKAVPIIVKRTKVRRASILTFNDEFGLSYSQANRRSLTAAGVNVVGVNTFGANTQDYSPYLAKLRSQNADSVFVAADAGPTAQIFKQLAQLGITNLVKVSAQTAASAQFVRLVGKSAAEGIYVTTPYVFTSPVPKNAAFVKAYRARYGDPPEADAAEAYDAMYLFADAVKRAGGTDPQKLRDALARTRLETVQGTLTFDAKGQGLTQAFLIQIRNGQRQIVSQLDLGGGGA